jgi:hypothetical protein
MIGVWRILRMEELHNSYSSPDIIRIFLWRSIAWALHVARREMDWIQGLVGETVRKGPLVVAQE